MNDLNESQDTKDIQPEVSKQGNISETAQASIQGIEPASGGEMEKINQVDFYQAYIDDRVKYYEDLLAHKQNVIEHEEDWKKKGFSVANELKSTDDEMKNTSRLLDELNIKKYEIISQISNNKNN